MTTFMPTFLSTVPRQLRSTDTLGLGKSRSVTRTLKHQSELSKLLENVLDAEEYLELIVGTGGRHARAAHVDG